MQDVIVTVTLPTDPSITGFTVTWGKDNFVPVPKIHSAVSGVTVYVCSYLTDNGAAATLNNGDIVTASVTTFNVNNVNSTPVVSVPRSVTIPNTPPLPPTSVTLALS